MDNLGAWTEDDLKKSIATYDGVAYYSELDHVTQFTHGIAKLLRKCLSNPNFQSQNGISVFILGTRSDYPSKRIPRLDSGLTPLDGGIWFVARQVVSGHKISIDANNDDELFEFVITDLQAGKQPAIIFDMKESNRMIRLYPKGLGEMDCCLKFAIDTNDLSPDAVYKAISHTHNTQFITPSASDIKLWESKEKHYPIKNIEREIQSHLVTGLASWFPACHVKKEQTGVTGRFDVAIVESDPLNAAVITHHILLELKVIKSYGSTGRANSDSNNKTWLESGLEQTYCYRREHKFKSSALCCFDMQKNDHGEKCFDHIRDNAKKLNIELWRWYLYNIDKAYRSAETSKALKD